VPKLPTDAALIVYAAADPAVDPDVAGVLVGDDDPQPAATSARPAAAITPDDVHFDQRRACVPLTSIMTTYTPPAALGIAQRYLAYVILALFVVLLLLFVVFPLLGMALWALFSTIVVGLVLGALGRLIVPGRQRISLLATVLAGIVGAIVGGYIGDRVFRLGGFATLLLEIAVSALLVAAMSTRRGARLSRLR
jgi:uncharacterized membrane protein YeaQ/YmgE (transglycosylase-associated protein family)